MRNRRKIGIKATIEVNIKIYSNDINFKTLPDITKFQSYLDEFGIEYRHHIQPEEEYKDLEALPLFPAPVVTVTL